MFDKILNKFKKKTEFSIPPTLDAMVERARIIDSSDINALRADTINLDEVELFGNNTSAKVMAQMVKATTSASIIMLMSSTSRGIRPEATGYKT